MSTDNRGDFDLSFLLSHGVKPNEPPVAIDGGGRIGGA